jgi:hypothetical protein
MEEPKIISNMLDIGILLGNCDTLMLETLKTIEKQRWLDITVQEKSERIFEKEQKEMDEEEEIDKLMLKSL